MSTVNHTTLPLLPLPSGVIFPEMVVTVAAESADAQRAIDGASPELVLAPAQSSIGLVARVEQQGQLPNGTQGVVIRGLRRVRLGRGEQTPEGALHVAITEIDMPDPTAEAQAAADDYRSTATQLLDLFAGGQMTGMLDGISEPGALADTFAWWPELDDERRLELFEMVDPNERIVAVAEWARDALAKAQVDNDINTTVREGFEREQREAILRRQMASIQDELGEGNDDDIAEYLTKLEQLTSADERGHTAMPEAMATAVRKELTKLERMGDQSMESGWIRTWLETVFDIPWGERTVDQLDLDDAQARLDADHTGLEKVKERIVEFLAVRQLRADRGIDAGTGGRGSGAILALVGPPGVGKTSLGESVAATLGRKFVRMSLGGIRDEAEIRGHRRTYVGARPGRVVRAMIDAGTVNPVILLDEIDKVGNDWRGDPSSALLEVLDPAQNATFRDHYLENDLDLSEVVFIATANVLDTIPAPLLDRMEIIHLEGYTEDEKLAIARDHLLPRLHERNGTTATEVVLDDDVIRAVVADYTREAGVRRLEQRLDRLVRRAVGQLVRNPAETTVTITPDDLRPALGRTVLRENPAERTAIPGVATGLAVTGAGGDVLFVEVSASAANEAQLTLTGQLGDVMKESAQIVVSYLRAHREELGIDDLDQRFHVHFPAGAVPKDGPSAGVTMTTAFVSLLTGRPMRGDVAMTGEVTLHGKVLPIGGVKEKVLAAHRAGVRHVVLPAGNRDDVDELPDAVRNDVELHFAATIDDVLAVAFDRPPGEGGVAPAA